MLRQWIWIGVLVLIGVPVWADLNFDSLKQDPKKMNPNQRVALVIGNAAYDQFPLGSSVNDADSMAVVLRACGFTVLRHTNLTHIGMVNAVRAFSDSIRRGGVGLFYYSGHGIQVANENYLLPVDVDSFYSKQGLQRIG